MTNQVRPSVAQRAKYVLMALIAAVEKQSVQDAGQVAQKLLHGIDLS
jgi:hypothetical protein